MTRLSFRQKVGGLTALVTCPCHAVPLALLIGTSVGSAWAARHVPILTVTVTGIFLASLWLFLRSSRSAEVAIGDAERSALAHIDTVRAV